MRLPNLSLHRVQTRMLAAVVLVMAAVAVGSLLLMHINGTVAVRKTVTAGVVAGSKAFERLIEVDAQRLIEGARQLAADPAFRETASGPDRGTLSPALAKHGRRIGSSVTLLIDSDPRIVAGSAPPPDRQPLFPNETPRS